jgi:hypothetical protein
MEKERIEESGRTSEAPVASATPDPDATDKTGPGLLTQPEIAGSRRTPRRAAKRDYREEPLDASPEEYIPARKRRKVRTTVSGSRGAARKSRGRGSFRPHRPRPLKKSTSNTEPNAVSCSYKEWPLRDAVLKCVEENGMATFQLQFSRNTLCMLHGGQGQPGARHGRPPPKHDSNKPREPDATAAGAGVHPVARILARWRKNVFLLQWADGSRWWVSRADILDKQMLRNFEAGYRGFNEGVDVLATRLAAGKRQYLLHWHGRPSKEDSWEDEDRMSPGRREE